MSDLGPGFITDQNKPPPSFSPDVVNVAQIAATIRQVESGNNYTAAAKGSTASGAYQFLDSTWQGLTARYGVGTQYPRAALAPAAIQDQVASKYISEILDSNNHDVAAVPVTWYIGHVPPAGSPEWDKVPSPQAGNTLTPRQYATKWLDLFHKIASQGQGGLSIGEGIIAGLQGAPGAVADTVTSSLDIFKNVWNVIQAVASWVSNVENWKRVAMAIGGGLLVLAGFYILASSFGVSPTVPGVPAPHPKYGTTGPLGNA